MTLILDILFIRLYSSRYEMSEKIRFRGKNKNDSNSVAMLMRWTTTYIRN